MNYDNLFFLIYQGGRAGEFLTSIIQSHVSLDKPFTKFELDYSKSINRYKHHDVRYYKLFDNWMHTGKPPSITQFNLPEDQKCVLRSHCFLPYRTVFPGCHKIVVISKNYNNFFHALYWIKHLLQPSMSYATAIDEIKHNMKDNNIKTSMDFLEYLIGLETASPNNLNTQLTYRFPLEYARGYKNCYVLDIDQLFIHENYNTYLELCKFMKMLPDDSKWQQMLLYHQRNVKLLEDCGVTLKEDLRGRDFFSQLKSKIKRIINCVENKPKLNKPIPYHGFDNEPTK